MDIDTFDCTCICGLALIGTPGHQFCDYDYEDLNAEQRAVVDALYA